jgi:predicted HTH transcriptional regulator
MNTWTGLPRTKSPARSGSFWGETTSGADHSALDFGKVSVRRNELIADLFFRLHKVERIGMGIQKMKEVMVAAGLREPAFEPDGFFRAIFQRSPEFALKEASIGKEQMSEELVEGLAEKLVEGLAETQKKILMLIAGNSRISKKAMAKSLGISTTAVDKNLAKLYTPAMHSMHACIEACIAGTANFMAISA